MSGQLAGGTDASASAVTGVAPGASKVSPSSHSKLAKSKSQGLAEYSPWDK